MTVKRFTLLDETIIDNEKVADDGGKEIYWIVEYVQRVKLVELLNELHEENEQLKTQLQNTSDQRDEFHRGARENANRVGKLEKENEQLKKELLFFYDVANCECSTNWKEDMEKGCKKFFNCTYEEAKEKYGDYDGMWWEIND